MFVDTDASSLNISSFSVAHVLAWGEDTLTSATFTTASLALWRPSDLSIVIGLSQDINKELNIPNISKSGINIIRRQSGGGAVLLSPGVLCWEAIAPVNSLGNFSSLRLAYKYLSLPISSALSNLNIKSEILGISDLAVNTKEDYKKIAGIAQLRRGNNVLVHGSLLISADISLIEKYLSFPSQTPKYRNNRSHTNFCLNLSTLMPDYNLFQLVCQAIYDEAIKLGYDILSIPKDLNENSLFLYKNKYSNSSWNLFRERHSYIK